MNGYDSWKTASPYDDFDDTVCHHCGFKLDEGTKENDSQADWLDDGYCSKKCKADSEAKTQSPNATPDPIFWRPMATLLANAIGDEKLDWARFQKALYKGTDAGVWVKAQGQDKITIGSIVEGSDAEATPITLSLPFTNEEFWSAVEEVNDEACAL